MHKCVLCLYHAAQGVWRQGEPIDQLVRGAARTSRSCCPLGVKDTDVTALITEAGSQRYKHSEQQLMRAVSWAKSTLHQLLYNTHPSGMDVFQEWHAKMRYPQRVKS